MSDSRNRPISVRFAVAYVQQVYGYPVAGRTVRKWLKNGHLAGELKQDARNCWWETTEAAIDEAWLAGRIPGKPGPKPSKSAVA